MLLYGQVVDSVARDFMKINYFLMLVERFAWFDQHEIITHEMFVGGARFALRQQTIS